MGIIDLTIEQPTWKRVDAVKTEDTAEPVATDEETASTTVDVSDESPDNEESVTESNSGGRLRRSVRVAGAVAISTLGLLTLRKLRNRGKADELAVDDSAE